jgi:hypothetical protein
VIVVRRGPEKNVVEIIVASLTPSPSGRGLGRGDKIDGNYLI